MFVYRWFYKELWQQKQKQLEKPELRYLLEVFEIKQSTFIFKEVGTYVRVFRSKRINEPLVVRLQVWPSKRYPCNKYRSKPQIYKPEHTSTYYVEHCNPITSNLLCD